MESNGLFNIHTTVWPVVCFFCFLRRWCTKNAFSYLNLLKRHFFFVFFYLRFSRVQNETEYAIIIHSGPLIVNTSSIRIMLEWVAHYIVTILWPFYSENGILFKNVFLYFRTFPCDTFIMFSSSNSDSAKYSKTVIEIFFF